MSELAACPKCRCRVIPKPDGSCGVCGTKFPAEEVSRVSESGLKYLATIKEERERQRKDEERKRERELKARIENYERAKRWAPIETWLERVKGWVLRPLCWLVGKRWLECSACHRAHVFGRREPCFCTLFRRPICDYGGDTSEEARCSRCGLSRREKRDEAMAFARQIGQRYHDMYDIGGTEWRRGEDHQCSRCGKWFTVYGAKPGPGEEFICDDCGKRMGWLIRTSG